MTALAQYEHARAALAKVTRVDELLSLLDEFELAKLHAKQIKDQALLADATEYQLRAERRLGEVIQAAKAAGLFLQGRQPVNGKSTEPELSSPRPTLAEAGIDKKLSAKAQERASISEQAFENVVRATRERIAAGHAKIIDATPAHMAGRVAPVDGPDYFPTVPWATRALMEHVMPHLGKEMRGLVWEPACGEGHIAEVLREYCRDVRASDVHAYGYSDELVDFLETDFNTGADWIVTNPPFEDRVLKFMLQARMLARIGVAMFVQLRYLEGVNRYNELYRRSPPTLIAFFVERVPLLEGRYDPAASTTTAFCWMVWIHGAMPRAPFWIPPACKATLTHPDDEARFTAHPVIRKENFNPETGEVSNESVQPSEAAE